MFVRRSTQNLERRTSNVELRHLRVRGSSGMHGTTIPRDVFEVAKDRLSRAGIRRPPVRHEPLLALEGLSEERLPCDPGMRGGAPRFLRGLLDLESRIVYLNGSLPEAQSNFTALHELGHWALPWHRDLLRSRREWDLPSALSRRLEEETNAFAAACLFLGPRFSGEARALPFSADSLLGLRDEYGVSMQAALIEYFRALRAGGVALLALSRGEAGRVVIGRFSADPDFPLWIPQGVPLPETHPAAGLYENVQGEYPACWSGTWPEAPGRRAQAFAVCNGFACFALLRATG
jgi:hypothetical protein